MSELSLVVSGAGIPKRKQKLITLSRVYALNSFPRLRKSPVSEGQLQTWRYVSDLGLADNGGSVILLIGQDNPSALTPLDIRKRNSQEPFAVRTVVGWTLNGPLVESDQSSASCNFIRSETEADVGLSQQVERFWKLDVLPTSRIVPLAVTELCLPLSQTEWRYRLPNSDRFQLAVRSESSLVMS